MPDLPISTDAWDSALLRFEQSEIYQTAAFLTVLERTYCLAPKHSVVKVNGLDIPVPLFKKQLPLLASKYFNAPFMMQLPLLSNSPEILENIFLQTEENPAKPHVEIKTRELLSLELRTHYRLQEYTPSLISELTLKASYPEHFASSPRKLREDVTSTKNRFKKTSYQLVETTELRALQDFYHLMLILYRDKHRSPCQPWTLFQNIHQHLSPEQFKVFAVYDGTVMLAGIFVFFYRGKADYAWAARNAVTKENWLSLLLDRAVERAIERGCTKMSFGCTDPTDKNLLFFKSRWGCVHSPMYLYSNRPSAALSNNNPNALYRRLYSKIPLSMLKLAMPWLVPVLV
jgi:hypothetical protein